MDYDNIIFHDPEDNMNALTAKIEQWAIRRGLHDASPDKQTIKYKGVEGFPNHVVTSDGRVFVMSYVDRNGRKRKERELKQRLNHDGYKTVFLSYRGKKKHSRVHRLVANAFVDNPKNKETVNHIDGVKTNNHSSNLEWNDRSEQLFHAYENGLKTYSNNTRTQVKKTSGKPVKCHNKKTGNVTYHITARDCSKFVGKSPRWCDKIIGTQDGETREYFLKYVSLEEVEENGTYRSLDSSVELIRMWSIEKGLGNSNPEKQIIKVFEEVGEVSSALLKRDTDNLKLEIGDVMVTLIILTQQLNVSLEECAEGAFNKIKDRRGKMVDGVFVKSEDL